MQTCNGQNAFGVWDFFICFVLKLRVCWIFGHNSTNIEIKNKYILTLPEIWRSETFQLKFLFLLLSGVSQDIHILTPANWITHLGFFQMPITYILQCLEDKWVLIRIKKYIYSSSASVASEAVGCGRAELQICALLWHDKTFSTWTQQTCPQSQCSVSNAETSQQHNKGEVSRALRHHNGEYHLNTNPQGN